MTRGAILMMACAATVAVVLPIWLHPVPRLIWNASASVPIGLYAVQPEGALHLDSLVVVIAAGAARQFPCGPWLSAEGRAAAEAYRSAAWADRLPFRPHDHCRWQSDWAKRIPARPSRPRTSVLARLPARFNPAPFS